MNSLIRLAVSILAIVSVSCSITAVTEKEDMNESMKTMDNDGTHDHSSHDHGSHDHEKTYEVPSGAAVPVVSLSVLQDTMSGWNLELSTSSFKFSPQNAGGEHTEGEGHAHIYIDGVKYARAYSEWYHVDHLNVGERKIMVKLATNDHRIYTNKGSEIMASVAIVVQE